MLRRKIRHVFRRGRPTNFRLGTWMEYDDPHHVTNVRNDVRSRRSRSSRQSDACLPITRKRKVSKTPKSAGRLSVPRLTFRTSCPRSLDRLTPWQKISHTFGTGRPGNFKTWYTDGVRWPVSPIEVTMHT